MDDFEEKKKKLLNPLFFEAGFALMDCQSFEYSIAFFLFHLSRLGTKGFGIDKAISILDNKDKKTLGQLIRLMKKNLKVSDEIDKVLEDALSARNYIIHRVLSDNIESLLRKETRDALIRKIRKLRRKVQKGIYKLDPFIIELSKNLDGIDFKEFKKELSKNFY
jgi:hypothetical protein